MFCTKIRWLLRCYFRERLYHGASSFLQHPGKKYGIVKKSLLEYVSCKKTFRTERILKDVSELYF